MHKRSSATECYKYPPLYSPGSLLKFRRDDGERAVAIVLHSRCRETVKAPDRQRALERP